MGLKLHFGGVATVLAALVVGLALGGFWPQTPLHATATDRSESCAIATGPLDTDIEAVFFLDFLTGDLRAAALDFKTGKFNAFYQYNVNADLGVDSSKPPKYEMVTGVLALRQVANRPTMGGTLVYVAETNGGKVAAYAVPWSRAMASAGRTIKSPLMLLDVMPFRQAGLVRGQP